jgi:hypothetical protein
MPDATPERNTSLRSTYCWTHLVPDYPTFFTISPPVFEGSSQESCHNQTRRYE